MFDSKKTLSTIKMLIAIMIDPRNVFVRVRALRTVREPIQDENNPSIKTCKVSVLDMEVSKATKIPAVNPISFPNNRVRNTAENAKGSPGYTKMGGLFKKYKDNSSTNFMNKILKVKIPAISKILDFFRPKLGWR